MIDRNFSGKISGGNIYIGDSVIASAIGERDREIYVGIRPEGFSVSENGVLECAFSNLEVMGRDVSVVASHANAESPIVRAILPSDMKIPSDSDIVRFSVKKEKLLVFDKITEERISF